MDAAVIKFKASGQQLSVVSTNMFAANTVSYIRAEFELGHNWDGFDSVRAVWATDFAKVATVLDNDGACTIPWEVLKRTATLYVNLVGSISDGDELTDRLTTYKVKALDVNGCTNVDGDNTQPITPSQFEQFVEVVHNDAEAAADARDEARGYASDAEGYRDEAVEAAADAKDYRDAAKGYADDAEGYKDEAKGYADEAEADAEEIRNMSATATTLPAGSSATASYSDGVLSLGIPRGNTGATGATGNGIASAVLNADYTLTLNFTNGTHYSTPPIRGAQGVQGETGNGIESVYLTATHGAVKTYTILFTDGTTTTFDVTDGEVTLAELASVLPTDTASGAIVSFPDGSDLFDYLSCVVDIDPVQDLHGYDKPWVGGVGTNKWDEEWESGSLSDEGVDTPSSNSIRSKNYISVSPNTAYCIATPYTVYMRYYDANKEFISKTDANGRGNVTAPNGIRTMPSNCAYVRFYIEQTTYNHDIAINYPSSVTTYSPYSNICPITGWTGCEVDVAGVNLFDKTSNMYLNDAYWSGGVIASGGGRKIVYIPCKPNTQYCASRIAVATAERFYLGYTKELPTIGGSVYGTVSVPESQTVGTKLTLTLTTGDDAKYLVVWAYWGSQTEALDTLQIETGSTASDYKPYSATTYPASWQTEAGTVYGGTVDLVTGVLTVDRAIKTFDGTEADWEWPTSRPMYRLQDMKEGDSMNGLASWLATVSDFNTFGVRFGYGNKYVYICQPADIPNVTDLASFKAYLATHNLTVVYPVATPITYQLDPVQVACLLGQNNVWADCGDIEEVQYKADVQKWVEKMLNA